MEFNLSESSKFLNQVREELDWEHSHAHWLVEEYSNYVLYNEMTAEEALNEWRQYLNDEAFGVLTPEQARVAEGGKTDAQILADMYKRSSFTMDRWLSICKCA